MTNEPQRHLIPQSIPRSSLIEAVVSWIRGSLLNRMQAVSFGTISISIVVKEGRAVELAINDNTTVRIRDDEPAS